MLVRQSLKYPSSKDTLRNQTAEVPMTSETTNVPTTDPDRCPQCGSSIATGALGGLCPRCLLCQAAMDTNDGEGSTTRPAPPDIEAVRAAFPQLEVIELIGHSAASVSNR